jgi:hypothetical protein
MFLFARRQTGVESVFLGARYSLVMSQQKKASPPSRIGLCADCRFLRVIESHRGSVFYQCLRSATDPSFPKYPRLPVLQCHGYEPPDANKTGSSKSPAKF